MDQIVTYEDMNALIALLNDVAGKTVLAANKTADDYLSLTEWRTIVNKTNMLSRLWRMRTSNIRDYTMYIDWYDYQTTLNQLKLLQKQKARVFANKEHQTYSGDGFYTGDNLTFR